MNPLVLKFGGVLAVAGALLFSGWQVRGWYEGNRALKEVRAQHAETQASINASNLVVADLFNQLKSVQAGRKEVVREITKVEYRDRECFDAGLISVLNAAARDSAPTDTAAGQVP